MHRTRIFHIPGILLSIALSTFALTAHAQSDESAQKRATDIWAKALEAMRNHDYVTACPQFEKVVQLRPDGIGAKLVLAECYEGSGRLASAWEMYTLIEPLVEKANQPDRQKTVHERVEALKLKLATLTIVVPSAVRALAGVEIKCDDKVVEPVRWNVPLLVDKGRHVIVVTAAERERGERIEEIGANVVSKTITIDPPAVVKPPSPKNPPESKKSVAPAVVLGVLAAGGIGSGIALMRLSAAKEADAAALLSTIETSRGYCLPEFSNYDTRCGALQEKLRVRNMFSDIAVGAFSAGGAAAAGMALYMLWPSPRAKITEQSTATNIQLTPILGSTGNGLLLSGSF